MSSKSRSFLRWPKGALRAGQHRVVVGEHGTRAALVAEQVAVDARSAPHQTVGGRALDQLVEVATLALRGYREPPVLDKRAGVDQIGDVLARGPPALLVAALDRVRACGVLGEGAPPQQLGEIVADGVVVLGRHSAHHQAREPLHGRREMGGVDVMSGVGLVVADLEPPASSSSRAGGRSRPP